MYMQSSPTCELSQLPSGFQVNSERPELCSGLSPPRRARVFVFVYGNRVFLGSPPSSAPPPIQEEKQNFPAFFTAVLVGRVSVFYKRGLPSLSL